MAQKPDKPHDHGKPATVGGTAIEEAEISENGARFMYVRGEVLVPRQLTDLAIDVLQRSGYKAAPAGGDKDDLETSFVRLKVPRRSPLEVSDLLLEAGIQASPNHVLTMAYHLTFIGRGLPVPVRKAPEWLTDSLACASAEKGAPVVVVVDTGIAKASKLPPTVSGVGDAVEPTEKTASKVFGHGTFVAGIIAAECPEADIRMIRPRYGSKASNRFGQLTDAQLGAAIESILPWVDEVDILNLSLGGFTHDNRPLLATGSAVTAVARRGVTVVAAAGNDGRRGEPYYPAAQQDVVAVGSISQDGNRSCFSNRGDWVNVRATGEDVISTFPATKVSYPAFPSGATPGCATIPASRAKTPDFSYGLAKWSGTSFAAARVSGALARARVSR